MFIGGNLRNSNLIQKNNTITRPLNGRKYTDRYFWGDNTVPGSTYIILSTDGHAPGDVDYHGALLSANDPQSDDL